MELSVGLPFLEPAGLFFPVLEPAVANMSSSREVRCAWFSIIRASRISSYSVFVCFDRLRPAVLAQSVPPPRPVLGRLDGAASTGPVSGSGCDAALSPPGAGYSAALPGPASSSGRSTSPGASSKIINPPAGRTVERALPDRSRSMKESSTDPPVVVWEPRASASRAVSSTVLGAGIKSSSRMSLGWGGLGVRRSGQWKDGVSGRGGR